MSKAFDVTVDEKTFTLRPFTIGQLERIVDLPENGRSFEIFRMAFERAQPPITAAEVNDLEVGQDELRAALEKIMTASGMKPPRAPADVIQLRTGEASPGATTG